MDELHRYKAVLQTVRNAWRMDSSLRQEAMEQAMDAVDEVLSGETSQTTPADPPPSSRLPARPGTTSA